MGNIGKCLVFSEVPSSRGEEITIGSKYRIHDEDEKYYQIINDFDDEVDVFKRQEYIKFKYVVLTNETDNLNQLSQSTINQSEAHEEICAELTEIYIEKNTDYGNSFSEQYQEHGITSSVIRLDDKMRRLKQLSKNDALVDESIEDTLYDMANYAIMTIMELKSKK